MLAIHRWVSATPPHHIPRGVPEGHTMSAQQFVVATRLPHLAWSRRDR